MRSFAFFVLFVALLMGSQEATVPTYHADEARSGHYIVPGLNWARAAHLQKVTQFDGRVSGHIYAQPLYWRPAGASRGLLIVATENNVVAALDASDGKTVWQRRLGTPVPLSKLECGNIDPLGITGTPVIDEKRGALYLDAMIDGAHGPRHLVFGLSLNDGAIAPGWPLDIADALRAKGLHFNAPAQNERAALTLAGDKLYIPYGGHYGECGDYHGWVVGFALDKPTVSAAWSTSVDEAGIWAPGGMAFDGRDLFPAVGQSSNGSKTWVGANAIVRLPLDLARQADMFAPPDWYLRNQNYEVLAYNNPVVIDPPGGGALLFTLDKLGKAYLLDRAHLGGVGHPLLAQQVLKPGLKANTSPAAWKSGSEIMLVAPGFPSIFPDVAVAGDELFALRLSGGARPAIKPAWTAPIRGQGAPIVTTSDAEADPIVWMLGAEGDGKLHGFRGDTGQEIFASGRLEGLRHYATILAAEGRLFFAGDGQIFAFAPAP